MYRMHSVWNQSVHIIPGRGLVGKVFDYISKRCSECHTLHVQTINDKLLIQILLPSIWQFHSFAPFRSNRNQSTSLELITGEEYSIPNCWCYWFSFVCSSTAKGAGVERGSVKGGWDNINRKPYNYGRLHSDCPDIIATCGSHLPHYVVLQSIMSHYRFVFGGRSTAEEWGVNYNNNNQMDKEGRGRGRSVLCRDRGYLQVDRREYCNLHN